MDEKKCVERGGVGESCATKCVNSCPVKSSAMLRLRCAVLAAVSGDEYGANLMGATFLPPHLKAHYFNSQHEYLPMREPHRSQMHTNHYRIVRALQFTHKQRSVGLA